MNPFFGILKLDNVNKELEYELTSIAFEYFSCSGVQNLSNSFENIENYDLPDNLKTMSGGVDDEAGEIIDEKVFSGNEIDLEFYFEGELEQLHTNINGFEAFLIENNLASEAMKKIEKNKEWRDSYKEFFKSVIVDEDLVVCPTWERDGQKAIEKVVIEPGLGFGTGGHETTFLCLEYLKNNCGKQQKILDLGCGSGILGIYTEKYKEASCDYVDVDPDALENCKLNLKLNDLVTKQNIFLRSNIELKKYDVVIANILLPILLEEMDLIISSKKDGGVIVFSGILKDQVEELKSRYLASGKVNKVEYFSEKNNWCCLVMS